MGESEGSMALIRVSISLWTILAGSSLCVCSNQSDESREPSHCAEGHQSEYRFRFDNRVVLNALTEERVKKNLMLAKRKAVEAPKRVGNGKGATVRESWICF
jgi:hypothetical protein